MLMRSQRRIKGCVVKKLSIEEVREVKEAQAEADKVRFASMSEAELAAEWEARMALYRKAFSDRPSPGTQEWRVWRGLDD